MLYGGDLLPGFYDDWTLDERNRLAGVFENLPPASMEPENTTARTITDRADSESSPKEKILPASITRFYGRAAEIEHVRKLISDDNMRLVTLTGLGGFGKTRMAIEVGKRLEQRVAFVALAEHLSTDSLPAALGDVFHLPRTPVDTLTKRLIEALAATPTAVILDNLSSWLE